MSPLLWTSKSLDKLSNGLRELNHEVSPNMVAKLLRGLGYSLQSNRKTREGSTHPDRDAQFQYLDRAMKEHIEEGSPVISVDLRRRNWSGISRTMGANGGRSDRRKRSASMISSIRSLAVPYGVYDIADNKGLRQRRH